jgi:hypothetical protein
VGGYRHDCGGRQMCDLRDAVCSDAGSENNFLDTEFTCGFDDVVGPHCVYAERLAVWDAHRLRDAWP